TYSTELGCLCTRRKRPCGGCTAKERYELAPPHSITRSARPSSGSGKLRPRALAVFRLMTSSTLGGLMNWKIGRLLALENAAGVYPEQTVRLREIASVAHETADCRKLAVRIYGWHCVLSRQLDKPVTLGQEERFTAYHNRCWA